MLSSVVGNDEKFCVVFEAIRQLMPPARDAKKAPIGFDAGRGCAASTRRR
jgi:hypothetical protein